MVFFVECIPVNYHILDIAVDLGIASLLVYSAFLASMFPERSVTIFYAQLEPTYYSTLSTSKVEYVNRHG